MANAPEWAKENGKERMWYAEHHMTKHVFLTSPMSPLPIGFVRHSTTNPREMDRIFQRLHDQERVRNEQFVEQLYNKNREKYERTRDILRTRMLSSQCSDAEKNIIREALKLMDKKDQKMQENNVYGVSPMQEAPEPLPGERKRVM